MNCREWEQAIALDAGGDLPEHGGAGGSTAKAQLEQHLAGCAGCREALEEQRCTLGFLRRAHGDPIAPAHYAAVRARVLAELSSERRQGWWGRFSSRCGLWPIGNRPQVGNLPHTAWWSWALGLAGAAGVALFVMLFPAKVKSPESVGPAFAPGGASGNALSRGVPDAQAALAAAPSRRHKGPRPEGPRPGRAVRTSGPMAPYSTAERVPLQDGDRDSTAANGEAAVAAAAQPLVIKLLTEDPDVVIYWIAESKGE